MKKIIPLPIKLFSISASRNNFLRCFFMTLLVLPVLFSPTAQAQSPNAFITTWKTTSANESITIPVYQTLSFDYNYTVDWGDGNTSSGQTGDATHSYVTVGTYTVSITGDFPRIQFSNPSSDDANDARLLTVEQWGTQVWKGMGSAFFGCKNLTSVSSTDAPILAPNLSLYAMFYGCTSFNSDLNNWNVSEVREMHYMFYDASSFNGNISGWDVSNVLTMENMFKGASAFNQNLNNWDVSKVGNMENMFDGATSFNGNIKDWDVGNVTNMYAMFQGALVFNQPLNNWNVSKVTNMASMFQGASAFNQPLNNWDVRKVTNMPNMFFGATSFNGNIKDWAVSNVTNMYAMFQGASAFNRGLNNWDVRKVTNMEHMFEGATSFNSNISDWKVLNVTTMGDMFEGAISFNRNISGWDVSNVTDMSNMFRDASAFDRNLGGWDVSNVTNMQLMLSGSGLSRANYDVTLIGWAAQDVQSNIELGAHGLTYCTAVAAHQSLMDNQGWTISGDKNRCLVVAQPDANGIVYVDSAIATPGNGSSWGQALQYLSNATESARINMAIKEINVAKGTYYPTGTQNISNRDSSFVIARGGLKLIGGYPNGGGPRSLSGADGNGANETILSGDINAAADTADNSYHVMLMQLGPASTDSLVLDGFTITMGNANNVDPSSGSGGLFFVELLGGGIVLIASESNTIAIRNNLFYKNYAHGGAGMFIFGRGLLEGSGDPNALLQRPSPFISNCIFKENATLSRYATEGSFLGGGGMMNFASAPLLDRCAFIGNTSNTGGAIMNFLYATSIVKNSIITKNSARAFSAAATSGQSGLTLINCLITENITTGIQIENPEGIAYAGTVLGSGQNSNIRLINSTLSGNRAPNATNTTGYSIMSVQNSKSFITNSIIWGNQFNSIGDTLNSSSHISYSLVQGMDANAQNHVLDGNLNPVFVDTANGNYQLQKTSLAINAGRNDSILNALSPSAITDLAGNSRIYGLADGGTVDLGTYEYQGNPIRPDANGILYVDSASAPGGDGNSWATALQSFGIAIDAGITINKYAPTSADSLRQVWVADGTYQPESGQSFFMLPKVKIYGGFEGTESDLIDRNLAAGDTSILLGNGAGVIRNDNNSLDTTALLDGFKITGGTAVGAGSNNSGGGVFNRKSSPAFSNLIINGNTASYVGGGISNRYSSSIFTNVVISGNKAAYAGGMGNEASSPVLTNVTISGNRAERFGGGMENLTASSPVVTNSIIWGNVADEGNEIYNKDNSTLILAHSLYGNGTNDVFEANANTIVASDTLTIDPLFVNAPAASDAPFTGGYYQLQSFSPAINAGTNDSIPAWDSTDVAGNSRIYDLANSGIVDMGAYEYQSNPIVVQPTNGILYVDSASASGGGDGSSWATALQSFGAAIDGGKRINSGNSAVTDSLPTGQAGVRQIWVAGGTYQPTPGASFYMLPKVKIYGGFSGTETSLTDRNLAAGYTSILLGNGAGVIRNDNNGLDSTALLDGFKITGADDAGIYNYVTSPTLSHLTISGNNGGVLNRFSSPVLTNVIIRDNITSTGAGMSNRYSSPSLTNVIISGNVADDGGGGGMRNSDNSSPVLINVTLSGNTATYGGGMYNDNGSSPVLINSILWGNTTDNEGNEVRNSDGSTITLHHSLYGNGPNDIDGVGLTADNAITMNPLFADATNGNYQLQIASPAINAGTNDSIPTWDSTDVAGNSRIYDLANNGVVDMGAYEFQGVPVIIQPANGILYVDKNVSGGNGSGDSWVNAIPELADALKWANLTKKADFTRWGDSNPLQIWVADGTYYPLYSASDAMRGTDGGRNNAFVMVPDVQLYGGFAGNEEQLNARDWETNETILSGDLDGSGNHTGTDALHVLIAVGEVGTARIDGFTVTGSNGNVSSDNIIVNGQEVWKLQGGGMHILSSSPMIANSTISGNFSSYGAGIHNKLSSPVLTNVSISDNHSNNGGGGGIRSVSSSPVLTNVIIRDNKATQGFAGGMLNNSSSPILTNVIIGRNSSEGAGGGMLNISSSPLLTNVTISGNLAGYDGGGLLNSSSSTVLLTNSIVWGNDAMESGNEISNEDGSSVKIAYSLYSNEPNDVSEDAANTITASDTLNVAPLFIDIANGNYNLQALSPAINTGINDSIPAWDSTDVAGNSRIYNLDNGGIVDMGAYEFQGGSVIIHPDANGIMYVDSAAAPGGNGSSWATALQSFGTAIDAGKTINKNASAAADSLPTGQAGLRQIWVADGTYQPEQDSSFFMLPKVKIYGSFEGTEISLAERELTDNYTSILLGNGNSVIINDNNSLDTSALLDGFKITGGNANGGLVSYTGGGIYNNASSPTLSHLIISGNKAMSSGSAPYRGGGGISNESASPSLINVIISDNTAGAFGGGMYNYNESSPLLINVIINDNTAGLGGGMYNSSSSPVLTNVTISGNQSGYGGGMNNASSSSVLMTNSIVWGNVAKEGGNEISNDASCTLIIKNSLYGNEPNDVFEEASGTITASDTVTTAPLFVDTANGNYQLQIVSPAINAGINGSIPAWDSTDVVGNSRIYDLAGGGIVDMGAYEYQGTCPPIVIATQPADQTVCYNTDAVFNVEMEAGAGTLSYRWQVSSDGKGFADLTATAPYSGVDSPSLTITGADTTLNGLLYRVILNNECRSDTSQVAQLLITQISIAGTPTEAKVGMDYSFTFSASGGIAPYTWSLLEGELPNGLILNEESGELSGTPDSATTYNLIFLAEDASGCTANKAYSLTVTPGDAPVITFPELEEVVYGAANFAPGATSSDDRQVEYSSSNENVALITAGGMIQIVGAGTADITAFLPKDGNFEDAETVKRTLTVNPATLTITANNDSKTYDGLAYNGGNGVLISGWAYDDTDVLLQGNLDYTGNSQGATNVGDYVITPSGYDAFNNYEFNYQSGTLSIVPAGQVVINFPELDIKTYGDADFVPGATSSDDRQVEYTSSDPDVAIITTNGLIQIVGAGTTEITASLPEDPNYEDAEPVTRELVVNPATLIVTANDDSKTYDGAEYSGGNGVTITGWAYDDTDALLQGNLAYTGNSQGAINVSDYVITPSGYDALNNYDFNYQSGTLSIVPAGQVVINFPELDIKTYGDADFAPGATSSDDRQVEYNSSDENVALITAGGMIQIVGAGTVDITAFLPEDANFESAEAVIRKLTVNKVSPEITWNTPTAIIEGTALSTVQLNAISDVKGSFSYDPVAGTILVTGEHTLTVSFIPSDEDNYNPAEKTVTITVTEKLVPVITWASPAPITYGTALNDVQLNAKADVEGTFVYAPNEGTKLRTGNHTLKVTFTPNDANYIAASKEVILEVAKADWTGTPVTFPEIDPIVYDGEEHEITADDVPPGSEVTYTIIDGDGNEIPGNSITDAGDYTVVVVIRQDNYEDITVSTPVSIAKAQVTITADALQTYTYDGTVKNIVANLNHAEITLGYGPQQGYTEVGAYTITITAAETANYLAASKEVILEIAKADWTGTPVTFPDTEPIVYDGEAHEITADDVPPGSEVTYTIIDGDGNEIPGNSITDAGDYTVIVVIHQDNYKDITVSTPVSILPAERTLVFDALPARTYGDADFAAGAESNTGEAAMYSSSNTAVAELVDGKIHITGAGKVTITATLPENPNYGNTPLVSRELTVLKAPQDISFADIGEVDSETGIASLDVSASSGLPVTLASSDEQVAVVAGENQLEILRLGTSQITATQPGNANYLAAQAVSRELKVVDALGSLIKVHPVVSPNGDGINEFLLVEGIRDYPVNRMTVVNRNGVKVFQIENYDNSERTFRGLTNNSFSDDSLLPQGTYFYLLEIKVGNGWERKTGWFVMKHSND